MGPRVAHRLLPQAVTTTPVWVEASGTPPLPSTAHKPGGEGLIEPATESKNRWLERRRGQRQKTSDLFSEHTALARALLSETLRWAFSTPQDSEGPTLARELTPATGATPHGDPGVTGEPRRQQAGVHPCIELSLLSGLLLGAGEVFSASGGPL